MVDNENQWEDMEYSEDSGDMDNYDSEEIDDMEYSDEEYSDEEYSEDGAYEAFEDEYYDEETEPQQQKKGNPAGCIIILLLLLLVIGGLAFFFLNSNKGASTKENAMPNNAVETQAPAVNETTGDLGDSFFNEAGGESTEMMSVDFNTPGETTVTTGEGSDEIVATVMEAPAQKSEVQEIPVATQTSDDDSEIEELFSEDSSLTGLGDGTSEIMVAYNKKTRSNPFKPPVIQKQNETFSTIGGTEFEIIEPPTTSVHDENLTRLLQTQISGILYDDESPSAIVNLNGVDQFVKIGDTVAGYKIESITKDKVQITYKNNTYVAAVGELFTRGVLEKQRAVADLENKFAGRYRNNN